MRPETADDGARPDHRDSTSSDRPETRRSTNPVERRPVLKGLLATGLVATLFTGSSSAQRGGGGHGPFRSSRFIVEIDGISTASFSRVELPAVTIPDIDYRAGTDSPTARKLSGTNEHAPVRLERGVSGDFTELYEWFTLAERGQVDDARRSMAVVLLSPTGEAGVRWEFRNAWPSRYVAPTLDGGSNEVALESLEISHEGMERVQ